MRYTFAEAEAFYWTARLQGFRSAALRLNLSQPTVGLRCQELGRILGGTLFDRSIDRPMLLHLGRIIYDYVECMLRIGMPSSARRAGPSRCVAWSVSALQTVSPAVSFRPCRIAWPPCSPRCRST